MSKLKLLTFAFIIPVHLFSQVQKRDTIIKWEHYEYTLNEYYSISDYSKTKIITTDFKGIVLENEIIRLCLVPSFGARVISCVYKPTGHEQLYQNEVGVPYLINSKVFYHNWLMLWGGIFPAFPEPEHGKYWNYPWNVNIVEETSEKVTVSMWLKDELTDPQKPNNYVYGVTNITCYFNVTLEAGKPTFDIDVKLVNDNTGNNYEFWTNTSFSPGSEIGNTFVPGNTEMVVPIEKYEVAWNAGYWMQSVDDKVGYTNKQVNKYKNLAFIKNWKEQGIAYAYPKMSEPYWGSINHDVKEGFFRIANKQDETPGLKFWGWGDEQGTNANVNDFDDYARPMIELWAGVSHEFFTPAYLNANEEKSWKETYMTTVGMSDISFINTDFAFHQELTTGTQLVSKTFVPVLNNGKSLKLSYEITDGNSNIIWTNEEDIVGNLAAPTISTVNLQKLMLPKGKYEITTVVSSGAVNNLYSHTERFELNGMVPILSSNNPPGLTIRVFNVNRGQLTLVFDSLDSKSVYIFDLQGRLLRNTNNSSAQVSFSDLRPGIYLIKVLKGSQSITKKVVIK